ncbi:type II secretion system protein GspJ [Photobacterium aquimaris]|uniref:Type II secretion system protein J n=1 Tax=Photobacterium aquimaris TaxID=512643 RepID=A0A2T3IH62_9GAMM|nr:type II secretion system minor pseudopilin GspJ [Photobacterium aquimaris]OBU16030.1 type II secretion system protein GspJ [Photobacterium aquimaris]OBU21118.1 type II secretion system protein GspJ [Photobacterium aquimaris]PSU26985.1 type II secretion system protein GspJ [Photobacterium aquimaris]PSV98453.1 type II secretion system protein GspJ [Photobacterium aquimaris]
MSQINRRQQQGFTLLEVLVAIAVFAMLSLSANQVITNVMRSDAQSKDHNQRLQAIQRTMIMMDNDFRQIVARKFRVDAEKPTDKILQAGEYLLDSSSEGITFVRGGWQNPQSMFPRGDITRVGYRIIDDNLERVWFRYPDTVVGAKPLVRVLLTGVSDLKFEFYYDKQWHKKWNKADSLPAGIKVIMTLKKLGEIERIYLLPTSALLTDKSKADA